MAGHVWHGLGKQRSIVLIIMLITSPAVNHCRELCPCVKMSGPTSFAPAIRQACRIVEQSGNQYHILVLLADGQVCQCEAGLGA